MLDIRKEIFPKPTVFYQSIHFSGERVAPVLPSFDLSRVHLFGVDVNTSNRILSQLSNVSFKSSGQLSGEYIIFYGGLLMFDRNGAPIKINTSSDDDATHFSHSREVEEFCISDHFDVLRKFALNHWDQMPMLESAYVLSEVHAYRNYYHFHIRLMPKVRTIACDKRNIVLSAELMALPFQKELIGRGWNGYLITPFDHFIRVKDPYLLHDPFSIHTVAWLRENISLKAEKGRRRLYISRGSNIDRQHGNIQESDEFRKFLDDRRFEVINFGSGEISVAQQVAMLNGASVIVAAHGANLTNIAYLDPEVSIIELLPYYWTYPSYMQIAVGASLNYFGIVCTLLDAEMRMVVDMKVLTDVFEQALAAAG